MLLSMLMIMVRCYNISNLIVFYFSFSFAEIRIPISRLIESVLNSLNNACIRVYYSDTYLDLLKDHILKKNVGQVSSKEWISKLFNLLYNV